MILQLVTPPTAPLVTAEDLRAHLRVDGTDQDGKIAAFLAAALSLLDGWRGILGRAIMPQTWAQEFCGWGVLRLAMPDVTEVRVTGYDADDNEVAPDIATLAVDAGGAYVTASGPAVARVVVEFDCGLPEAQLPAVRVAAMMLVANWFENREAVVVGGAVAALPFAVDCLIEPLRWRAV